MTDARTLGNTRLFITSADIRRGLRELGNPGTNGEADVMVAAQAVADWLDLPAAAEADTLRSRVAALEEAVATFLSIAYPSGTGHPADRAADDLRLALAPTPDR